MILSDIGFIFSKNLCSSFILRVFPDLEALQKVYRTLSLFILDTNVSVNRYYGCPNSEDPFTQMKCSAHKAAFHLGLHYLLCKKKSSVKEYTYFYRYIGRQPLKIQTGLFNLFLLYQISICMG